MLPILQWVREYDRAWLRTDALSGATVWAVLVPSALAYAVIVGVEPMVGLYTVPLALVGYAVFGGSRLLVVGPDAAISVLAASTIAGVTTGDDFVELTIALALLAGVIHLVMYALRMGWVADLVGDPVIRGFVQGLVWVTILDQIPKLLGFTLDDSSVGFFRQLIDTVRELGERHPETAILGVASLIALFALKRIAPKLPGPLIILAAAMAVVGLMALEQDGVGVVGEPTGPLFDVGLPQGIELTQVFDMIPGALAIVVLGFTQSGGASKAAARHTGERIDPNQELLALGVSNLGAGISGGYVVTGTLSKTGVAISSGGRTQVGNLVAAALTLATILVLRPLFEVLALTVLAAIVVFAMSGMIEVAYFQMLWRLSRIEFGLAVVAFLGVLIFGVLPGVVVAMLLSLVLLIRHVGDPPTTVLGRTPDGTWADVQRRDDARPVDGVLVWRQEAPLVFLNARRLTDRLRDQIGDDVQAVIIDASVVSGVDTTGISAFMDLEAELEERGIDLCIVHPLARTWARVETQARAGGRSVPAEADTIDDALDQLSSN